MNGVRYRIVSVSGLRATTLADLRVQDEITMIHDYSKQREGKACASGVPLAVILPYSMFVEWQKLFQEATRQSEEMSAVFGRFRMEKNT